MIHSYLITGHKTTIIIKVLSTLRGLEAASSKGHSPLDEGGSKLPDQGDAAVLPAGVLLADGLQAVCLAVGEHHGHPPHHGRQLRGSVAAVVLQAHRPRLG